MQVALLQFFQKILLTSENKQGHTSFCYKWCLFFGSVYFAARMTAAQALVATQW